MILNLCRIVQLYLIVVFFIINFEMFEYGISFSKQTWISRNVAHFILDFKGFFRVHSVITLLSFALWIFVINITAWFM